MRCKVCQREFPADGFYVSNKSTCKGCRREEMRRWNAAHPGYAAERMRQWVKKNPARYRANLRRRYDRMRAATVADRYESKVVKQRAQWLFLANQIPGCLEPKKCKVCKGYFSPDDFIQSSGRCRLCERLHRKEQKARHPEKYRRWRKICRHRREAKKREKGGRFTAADWRRILECSGHRCVRCGATGAMTVDHIIPLSNPLGTNDWTNIQPMCMACNTTKLDSVTGAVQSFIPGLLTTAHVSRLSQRHLS